MTSVPDSDYSFLLKRIDFLKYATLGEFWIWNKKTNNCPKKFFSLEPPKLPDERGCQCIPEGKYSIGWQYMLSHDVCHYELIAVPMRSGIFIHKGNSVIDTTGCILVGEGLILPDQLGQYKLKNSSYAIDCIEMYLAKLDSNIIIYH